MENFIHWIYENNLFINDGIIYDTTYGCSKQYIFSNEMLLLSVMTFTPGMIIYGCINDDLTKKRKSHRVVYHEIT